MPSEVGDEGDEPVARVFGFYVCSEKPFTFIEFWEVLVVIIRMSLCIVNVLLSFQSLSEREIGVEELSLGGIEEVDVDGMCRKISVVHAIFLNLSLFRII